MSELLQKGLLGMYFLDGAEGSIPMIVLRVILAGILPAIVGYLLGSVNFAVMISQKYYRDDIRSHGSGNAGMTNVMRTYGRTAAALTFVGDFMKTVLALFAGALLMGGDGKYIAGLFCVIGHIFPLFFHFKGGKGVVCAGAVIICTEPPVGLVLLALFIGIVALSKYISLGSVMCMLMYPLMLARMYPYFRGTENVPFIPMLVSFCIMVIIIAKHRDNIRRLMKGEENKFSFKKSVKKSEAAEAEASEAGAGEKTEETPVKDAASRKKK